MGHREAEPGEGVVDVLHVRALEEQLRASFM